MRVMRTVALAAAGVTVVGGGFLAGSPAWAGPSGHSTFIGRFHHISNIASTVPGNGDVNPYGVAVVRRSQGRLHRGDVLVSNFNNKANLQGTGRTIVEISPSGRVIQFASIRRASLPGPCPGGVGDRKSVV